MSTFNGFVSEFPNLRIDYFRILPGRPPPLACFLSHVHSDHLVGLESFKSPFVYCSSTTRELLLKLEKYPHRMNFSKGILESRKQTYKHLRTLLKPIPLETPTKIELSPGNDIQVTLFDANHCAGAVAFLIEGQGNAIFYTGDVRSEEWWVNSLIRHPKILPYLSPRKRLNKIYLDTTFAVKTDPYRSFPSKANGLQELLDKLDKYPPSTIFYFQAWTFGYEDVWLMLSQALQSPVHLDRYRYSLYTSVHGDKGQGIGCREAPVLCGFKCGNVEQPGILTKSPAVRLHSCERGTGCKIGDSRNNRNIVTITPILSRHAGVEMRELGAGGGQGDLDQIHELDLSDPLAVMQLMALCSRKIDDIGLLNKIKQLLESTLKAEKSRLQLDLSEHSDEELGHLLDEGNIPLEQLPKLIVDLAVSHADHKLKTNEAKAATQIALPNTITFPYSRHSSYGELCHLVGALRPRDIWPCTAPPAEQWTEEFSMQSLFGGLCDNHGDRFAYDVEMRAIKQASRKRKRQDETQRNEDSEEEGRHGLAAQRPTTSDTESEEEYADVTTHPSSNNNIIENDGKIGMLHDYSNNNVEGIHNAINVHNEVILEHMPSGMRSSHGNQDVQKPSNNVFSASQASSRASFTEQIRKPEFRQLIETTNEPIPSSPAHNLDRKLSTTPNPPAPISSLTIESSTKRVAIISPDTCLKPHDILHPPPATSTTTTYITTSPLPIHSITTALPNPTTPQSATTTSQKPPSSPLALPLPRSSPQNSSPTSPRRIHSKPPHLSRPLTVNTIPAPASASASVPTTTAISRSNPNPATQRLLVRKKATKKAEAGLWHEVGLESVGRKWAEE